MKEKRIGALILSALCLATTLGATACGGGVGNYLGEVSQEEVDLNRTQLYVGLYNGGLGRTWLDNAKERFEAENPDVQIMIDPGKDEWGVNTLVQDIKTNRQDLYFLDTTDYYRMVAQGHFLDITDTVTKGGESSLENKLNASLRDYYRTDDGKYYGLPWYEAYYSMNYDKELFDQKLLWLNEAGDGFVKSLDEPRYKGPEGGGAWDDGLPYTYDQFFMLLEQMYRKGVTAFTWSGMYKDEYMKQFSNSLVADYMGEEFKVNYTMDGTGTVKYIEGYDFTDAENGKFALPEGKVATSPEITLQNAEQYLSQSAGRYFGMKFTHDILSEGRKYVTTATVNSSGTNHLQAQADFVRSNRSGKPIAMLIDGGWWFNEAKVEMNAMETAYGSQYSAKNRRFGIMPIPKAEGSASGRTVSSNSGGSCAAISAYTSKKDLAIKFYEFLHSEQEMQYFTAETGVAKPFAYDVTGELYESMDEYSKQLVDMRQDITIEYTVPRRHELLSLYEPFSAGWLLGSKVEKGNNKANGVAPTSMFFDYPSFTAVDGFEGIAAYLKEKDFLKNLK